MNNKLDSESPTSEGREERRSVGRIRSDLACCFGDSHYDKQTWAIVAEAFDSAVSILSDRLREADRAMKLDRTRAIASERENATLHAYLAEAQRERDAAQAQAADMQLLANEQEQRAIAAEEIIQAVKELFARAYPGGLRADD